MEITSETISNIRRETTMKRFLITVTLAVLALALGVSAQQPTTPEPYSIKTDKLGESTAEWIASDPTHNNWSCSDQAQIVVSKTVTCSKIGVNNLLLPKVSTTYAGNNILNESASFALKDGKIILYKVEIDLLGRSQLMEALQDKFGTPAEHLVIPVHNGFGAQFEIETWNWANGISSLELMFGGGPPNTTTLTFTLDGPAKEIKDRQDKEAQTKAHSDM